MTPNADAEFVTPAGPESAWADTVPPLGPSPVASPRIRAGTVIGRRFRLVSVAGTGGGGTVWKAHDGALDRFVALKLVSCAHGLDTCTDPERPLREARAAARLNHPGTITIYDLLTENGETWIVMELVLGESLQDAVAREGRLPARRVAGIGLQVLSALCAAHRSGIVHCDVKPSNILLTGDDQVVLTDFGLAVEPCRRAATPCEGSPPYISPEQALGRPITAASDLWGLGATLYAALEGRSPYQRDEPLASLLAVVTEDSRRPSRASGPLGTAIERLLCKDPAERATAADVAPLLEKARTRRR